MKVELHLHTSRYSGCARNTPSELVERMIELGYDALFITEHDAVWSPFEITQLQEGYPQIRVFPGMERSFGQTVYRHILVLGTSDPAYLAIRTEKELIDKARAEGHLTVLAHPFRWEGGEELLASGVRPDALENRTNNHDAAGARQAEAAANRYDLSLVNAGDTHALDFLGKFWIETARPLKQADDIRRIVLASDYVNKIAAGVG